MDDPILRLRLDMLTENLDAVLRMPEVLTNVLSKLAIDGRLSEVLQISFENFASRLRQDLRDAGKALEVADMENPAAVRACWDLYAELDERNAQLHREFLEAMIGLTVRREQIDNSLCEIADALILSMNRLRLADTLAIPVSREADSRTLARLVRMRFPEWSIWSLPLVAYEFGHVAIEDVPEVAPIVKKVTKDLLEREPQGVKEPRDARDEKRSRATTLRMECRVRKLLADAFALYTIGPSYACSLILMRLKPDDPDFARPPRDAERAAFVLDTMRVIAEHYANDRYNDVIQLLEREWNGAMQRSGVDPLTVDEQTGVENLSRAIDRELAAALPGMRYGSSLPGGAGWSMSLAWFSFWDGDPSPNRLQAPGGITGSSKLYDALNAAWIYRLFSKNRTALEPVAHATRELCRSIMKAQREAQGGGAVRRGSGG